MAPFFFCPDSSLFAHCVTCSANDLMAEFPDIFACVSCDKALFLDEDERTLEKYPARSAVMSTPRGCPARGGVGGRSRAEVAEDDAVDAAPAEPPETESAADETVEETPSIDEPDEEALSTDEPVEPAPEASDEAAADSEEEPVVEEPKVDDASPENLELPDVFACLIRMPPALWPMT